MNSYLVLFFFIVAGCAAQDDGAFLKSHLPGKWKEDQHKRKNLNNYLYEMGLNWFKRVYVTSTNWENTQDITLQNGDFFSVHGTKGPYATKYDFVLFPDGKTRSDVDLGQLGGKTTATARFEGNTLTTYLTKKGKKGLFMTAKRIMNPERPNEMIYEVKHIKSGVALTSYMYRQN